MANTYRKSDPKLHLPHRSGVSLIDKNGQPVFFRNDPKHPKNKSAKNTSTPLAKPPHSSKKPTDPFGRLTMTALDGIVNYLFYNNTSKEEVKTSKDQKKPNQENQTSKTVIPPKQKEGITSGINTDNPTQKPYETPALPTLHAFLASLFKSVIPGTSPSQPNATSAQDPKKETSFRV